MASSVVWFEAYVTNIDRTPRNVNMLIWHNHLWVIDHGKALYFHRTPSDHLEPSRDRSPFIKDHVLLPLADILQEVDTQLVGRLTADSIERTMRLIPDIWLQADASFNTDGQHRGRHAEYLLSRLESRQMFLEEASGSEAIDV